MSDAMSTSEQFFRKFSGLERPAKAAILCEIIHLLTIAARDRYGAGDHAKFWRFQNEWIHRLAQRARDIINGKDEWKESDLLDLLREFAVSGQDEASLGWVFERALQFTAGPLDAPAE